MEDGLQSTLDFEFGIVGDQLGKQYIVHLFSWFGLDLLNQTSNSISHVTDLSDDEDLLWQVSVQASKVELQRQQEANFTAWREDLADQFQHFLTELVGELQPRQDDYLARLNIVGRLSSVLDDMDSFRGKYLHVISPGFLASCGLLWGILFTHCTIMHCTEKRVLLNVRQGFLYVMC